MLGTAACMAGTDGEVSQRLPDVRGLKSEVLIQRSYRYKYDRQASMTGASLVEVGSETGASADDFTAAINEDTGMILYPAHLETKAGSVPLAEVAAVAVRHDPATRDDLDEISAPGAAGAAPAAALAPAAPAVAAS